MKLEADLTTSEYHTHMVALEAQIRQMDRWTHDRGFGYWEHRRDQLFRVYKKFGGEMELEAICQGGHKPVRLHSCD